MAKAATNAAAAAGSGAGKEGKGILKTVPVSQTLANFAGESELSRATAVKKVWEHIKGNNLQVQFSRSFFFELFHCLCAQRDCFLGDSRVGRELNLSCVDKSLEQFLCGNYLVQVSWRQ